MIGEEQGKTKEKKEGIPGYFYVRHSLKLYDEIRKEE